MLSTAILWTILYPQNKKKPSLRALYLQLLVHSPISTKYFPFPQTPNNICHTSPKKGMWTALLGHSVHTLKIILLLGVLIYNNVWLQPKGEEKTWLWNQKCWIKPQYHLSIVWIWPKSFNNYTFITITGNICVTKGGRPSPFPWMARGDWGIWSHLLASLQSYPGSILPRV